MGAQETSFFKIIIPNYNNGKYISACLESILNQTFKSFSVIIIDDVSDDNSADVIQEYTYKYNNINAVFLSEKK